jgi:N-acetylmuramoyl-L-alanine amidase
LLVRPINQLVVHCSATQAGRNFTAADVDAWHKQRGFDDIGYHYVVRLDGKVEPGRPESRIGAHAAGYNAHSIGVCLIGGLDGQGRAANTFTPAQFAALESLLLDLRGRYPKAQILGHRDLPKVAKACPSFDAPAWCRTRGITP